MIRPLRKCRAYGGAWGPPTGRCSGSFCQSDQLPVSRHVLRDAFQCIFAVNGVVLLEIK